jgi:lipoprotein-releasing system permease protein
VYYFSSIPDKVDWLTAAITWVGAVVFSVLGASVPAAKAADIDPVRALRYE